MKENNTFYQDIAINYNQIDSWEDEFIPVGIETRVLQYNTDHQEREGYVANLSTDNYENVLHHAVDDAELNDDRILSGRLYTDADDNRTHPTLKLVSALTNYKNNEKAGEEVDLPFLTYTNKGNLTPLNDWDNPNYFTASFLTLFPFGIGGHITPTEHPRKAKVSLKAWGKWALSHHSRW